MGLEALGNAMGDLVLDFSCPSPLWLSGRGLLVWEVEEGVLVAHKSRGANFLYLSLKKVLGNCNCSILESPVSLQILEHILPFPCQKPCPPGACHGELMEYVLLGGSKMPRGSYLLFLYAVLLFSTFQGEEKGKMGN